MALKNIFFISPEVSEIGGALRISSSIFGIITSVAGGRKAIVSLILFSDGKRDLGAVSVSF